MKCIFHKWKTTGFPSFKNGGKRTEVCQRKNCGKTRVVQVYDVMGKEQFKKSGNSSIEITHEIIQNRRK